MGKQRQFMNAELELFSNTFSTVIQRIKESPLQHQLFLISGKTWNGVRGMPP
ncbi:unnamed protein product [Brugia timori]|uniref:AraC family transcriptional regulator n=1 Tax=Brugia timori TaxID=42155 RepID=A0A0R3Q592_9BILA|nr:unnamed protein product [Brugia timori]